MGVIQDELFPKLENTTVSPLTDREKELVTILGLIRIEKYVLYNSFTQWMGRKVLHREAIARSFVAKAVYGFTTTRNLIEALRSAPNLRLICGFKPGDSLPSEATFSRAFAEFAKSKLGERVHAAMVEAHLKPELVGHISRDSTPISGHEKAAKKIKAEKPAPKKRGRPKKGEQRPSKEEKRMRRQQRQSSQEAMSELPRVCDVGSKKDSKGNKKTWVGYKFHADISDSGLPVSVALSSASLHDSQVAIPLMKLSSSRVDYLYDVMDAAYDAKAIYEVSRQLGHVPLIDRNSRGKDVVPMAPHEKLRYNERSVAERFNSRIKEEFGAENVRVRGDVKVMMHLMFGVVALFGDHLIKLATP